MVSAWLFNPTDDDQFNPSRPVSLDELSKLGVFYFTIDVTKEDHLSKVDEFSAQRNYKNRDIVNIRRDTLPNYEEKIKSFFEEHIHEDEEIRFILDGTGYFDVRSRADEWIRISVQPSDLLVLPAGIYHRFTLDSNNYIKAMRLFKEDPKWTPINRDIPTTDANPHRVEYAHWLAASA